MRKLILMVGLVVVAIACSSGADMLGEILDSGVPDAGAQPGGGGSMQYVGNTSQTFTGGTGLYPAYAACQSDYGAGHRICELDEIRYTTSLPQLTNGEFAWASTEGCRSWTSGVNTDSAPYVNSTGNTSDDSSLGGTAQCGDAKPFACCGPK